MPGFIWADWVQLSWHVAAELTGCSQDWQIMTEQTACSWDDRLQTSWHLAAELTCCSWSDRCSWADLNSSNVIQFNSKKQAIRMLQKMTTTAASACHICWEHRLLVQQLHRLRWCQTNQHGSCFWLVTYAHAALIYLLDHMQQSVKASNPHVVLALMLCAFERIFTIVDMQCSSIAYQTQHLLVSLSAALMDELGCAACYSCPQYMVCKHILIRSHIVLVSITQCRPCCTHLDACPPGWTNTKCMWNNYYNIYECFQSCSIPKQLWKISATYDRQSEFFKYWV